MIKQGIEELYKDHIQHEEEVQEQKTNDQEQKEQGKMSATQIKEATLGHLQQCQTTRTIESCRQTRSETMKDPPRTKEKSTSSSAANS